MKRYPLAIENVGGDTYILMSKGHHSFEDFMKAIGETRYQEWGLENPQHVWLKAVPRDGYAAWYAHVEQGVRGAFPATMVQEGW